MYEPVRDLFFDLLQAPKEPPVPPVGTPGSTQVFRAAPQFLTYRYIRIAIGLMILALLGMVISTFMIYINPLAGVLTFLGLGLLWFLFGLALFFLARLEYDLRYYIITDRSLRVRKGVLHINEQTLTYINVQNISIQQGPIQRMFGIFDVQVDAAGGGGLVTNDQGQVSGGGGHNAVMEGLENAEQIRDIILTYLKKVKPSSGLGDPDSGTSPGFTSGEVAALREILDEVKTLRGQWPQ